jgi:hypothetical protein
VAKVPLAVPAAVRAEVRTPAERLQVAQRVVTPIRTSPPRPPSPRRGALGYVRLPPEGQTSVASGAGTDLDGGAVEEHEKDCGSPQADGRRLNPVHPRMRACLNPSRDHGASTGIGAATARHAVDAGYRVSSPLAAADKLEALAGELGGPERRSPIATDVTEWESQVELARRTKEAFGRIDVVFANAASAHRGASRSPHRALEGDGPHERLRRGADHPRTSMT